jgi:cytidylate kinase
VASRIIAISGKSGCGNTTVSRLLAERLGVRLINYTFRQLAEEKGISFEHLLELAAKDTSYDRAVDERQTALAREGDCVIGSRLALWLLPEAALHVYLWASPEVRAGRILGREGGDKEAVMAFTANRDRKDHERYKRLYGIDNDDWSKADITINTEQFSPTEIAWIVEAAARARR